MKLLKLKGEKVIGVFTAPLDYTPKVDEVLAELPPIQLKENEIGYIYYRDGKVEYEIKERG